MDARRFAAVPRSLARQGSRRGVLAGVGALAAGMVLGHRPATARAGKAGVCHRTGNGSYVYIEVSERAAPAHARHGDAPGFGLCCSASSAGSAGSASSASSAGSASSASGA